MRLLLIEDNQRLADYLATALQNGGFAVDHVSTTADAEGALAGTLTTRCFSILVCPIRTDWSGSASSAAAR